MRASGVGIEADRGTVLLDRFVEPAFRVESGPKAVVHRGGIGIEADGDAEFLDCFVELGFAYIVDAFDVVGRRRPGFEKEGLFDSATGKLEL